MKEASGELNMTVVTIVAVAAVGTLFVLLVYPMIQGAVASQSCKAYGDGWHAVSRGKTTDTEGRNVTKYACCPKGQTQYSATKCVDNN